MVDVALSVIAFIVAIAVLVAVHEYGHFWVARKLGFKVLRFSIGFGKPLARWVGRDPDRVEYWISAIPLGGYVKMLDEREGPVSEADLPRAFNHRPVAHRVAVLLAGPGFNFLFAIIAYWAMFVSGVPGIKPIIGEVTEGSVAASAGLRAEDQIMSIGGRSTSTWENAVLGILDELLGDGRIDLMVSEPNGNERFVELDVRGRESELTEPDALFSGLGIRPGPLMPAIIAGLQPGLAGEAAGFVRGDRVLEADGEVIRSWSQWVEFIRERPGEQVSVHILRDGRELELALSIGEADDDGARIGRIGAWRPDQLPEQLVQDIRAEQRYGVFESLPQGIRKTWEMTALTVRMLARMVVGDVSLRNVSGPISIAAYAGASAEQGLTAFLGFLSIVSISLGIMNLLPIPLLDGGQIVYQLAELLKGSPLSERAMAFGQQLGIFFLIVLMSFVFYNDITRIFG